jgi:hypothetical protein
VLADCWLNISNEWMSLSSYKIVEKAYALMFRAVSDNYKILYLKSLLTWQGTCIYLAKSHFTDKECQSMRKGISRIIRVSGSSLLVLLAFSSMGVHADSIDVADLTEEDVFGKSGLSGQFTEHHNVHVGDSKPGKGPNYCKSAANLDFIPGAGAWNASENGLRNRQLHGNGGETYAVPEPGTLALLGIGLIGMGIASRRRVA